MTRLVSVGNAIVDLTVAVTALPERGGDTLAQATGTLPGGSVNTLVAARRQGLEAAYAGGHGTGPFGDLVRAALAREGIDVLLPPHVELDTGYDVAMVEPDGERTFVTVFGAEAAMPGLDGVRLLPGDLLHVSGYGLLERTNAAVIGQWLAGVPRDVLVLLDPGPLVGDIPPAVWTSAAARADWISCSARKAHLVTGFQSPGRAAAVLAQGRAGGAVVRLGAGGCLVASGAAVELVPGFDVIAVDTSGAGDAHVGAFLAALTAGGRTAVEAARWANAAAALAVSSRGPGSSPTAAEVGDFLRQRTAPPPR